MQQLQYYRGIANGPFSTSHDQASFSCINPCTVQEYTEERIRYVMLKKSREEEKKNSPKRLARFSNSTHIVEFSFWADSEQETPFIS